MHRCSVGKDINPQEVTEPPDAANNKEELPDAAGSVPSPRPINYSVLCRARPRYWLCHNVSKNLGNLHPVIPLENYSDLRVFSLLDLR